jgi:Fic-DOC domain mobile mystery protein B
MKIEYAPGATPLDTEDWADLIPTIATQGDLNEFETQNILRGEQWARSNNGFRSEFPSFVGLNQLHGQMLGDTWKWAGKRRLKNGYNIGIDFAQIPEQVGALCRDVRLWIEDEWQWPEVAVRFHHRLVWIHPYTNGNGRHSRLAAELLLEFNRQPRLPWGGAPLVWKSAIRTEYIAALKEANDGGFDRLLKFAQSSER